MATKTDYREVFNTCYQELSPSGKQECDQEIHNTVKKFKQHKRDYVLARHGFGNNGKINNYTGMGEESAKELITALIMKGFI